VYLEVARDPYVFILGSLAVMAGVIVEVTSGTPTDLQARVREAGNDLQTIAVASLLLSIIGALYANKFVHVSDAVTDLIVGRYAVVFPTLMVLLSYLITVKVRLDVIRSDTFLGIVSMLLVPAVVYEVGKRYDALGFGLGLVFAIAGVYFLTRKSGAGEPSK
jgi:hypothetical protein